MDVLTVTHDYKNAPGTSKNKLDNPSFKEQKNIILPQANSQVENIFSLQKTIGNQAVMRLLRSGTLWPEQKASKMEYFNDGSVIQCLMDDKNFSSGLQSDPKEDKFLSSILKTLAAYNEKQLKESKKPDYKGLLGLLNDLDKNIYAWFDTNKAMDMSQVKNSKIMSELLQDSEEEHQKIIGAIKSSSDVNPFDTKDMEEKDVKKM